MRKRTSRKQVIKYLERKINNYHCGCKDRTHLVRAVEVLKKEVIL